MALVCRYATYVEAVLTLLILAVLQLTGVVKVVDEGDMTRLRALMQTSKQAVEA